MENAAPNVVALFDAAATANGQPTAGQMTSPDLAALFAGADVGLALFGADLRLLACNLDFPRESGGLF